MLSCGLEQDAPIARTGAWLNDHTLVIKACFTRTPYVLTLTAEFEGDTVSLTPEWNVAFGPRKGEALQGSLVSDSPE